LLLPRGNSLTETSKAKRPSNQPEAEPAFLDGGGEMGALMRGYDWAATPLGPPSGWPQSLKTAVRILLTSRFAMWMAWGPELTFFCNDAYRPTLGVKQDWALGSPSSEVWAEIWPDIGPRIETVLNTGNATYDENLLLFLERSGFPEETYHTFSYSPLSDDGGTVAGMFCVVSEETERVIGERRLKLLRDLASDLSRARTEAETFSAFRTQAKDQKDLPFTLTYLFDAQGAAELVCATGSFDGDGLSQAMQSLTPLESWPVTRKPSFKGHILVDDLASHFKTPLPANLWNSSPKHAAVALLSKQGQTKPAGYMVVALNPFRRYDTGYAGFIDLLAGQLAASLDNARAYEEERRRAESLAEIDRAKTVFFSNVSHEFRTPLTLMLGPLEELLSQAQDLPGAAREQLQVIHRNSLRLLKLVNSLLDFSRIEAGRFAADFQPVDLASLTSDLASNFRSACERAGLNLAVDCPPLPAAAHVDSDMWEKIVLNLISNAFKFTFEGEIQVRLRAVDGQAVLTVRDTGIGIPEAELPRLFERFHRIEGAQGRSHEGSGIGLALIQELVKLHGGSITVESEVGRGSAFTVSVPLRSANPSLDIIDKSSQPASRRPSAFVEEALRWLPGSPAAEIWAGGDAENTERPKRGRVLVADDNADMRDYIARLLSGTYEVESVPDGRAALEAVLARRPDLILTDIMMPGLDGFGLIHSIRENAELRELPIIVLSARAGEDATIEGRAAGADDYLVKPFSARELLGRVDAAFSLARLRRETSDVIRETSERLRAALRASRTGTFRWHFADSAILFDEALNTLFGLPQEASPQTLESYISFVHPEDRAEVRERLRLCAAEGAAFDMEYRIQLPEGGERWLLGRGLIFKDGAGRPHYMTGACLDITDLKRAEFELLRANETLEERVERRTAELERTHRQLLAEVSEREAIAEQLRQSRKMEAVGKLTGGIAHDFNNLLQIIGGNLQLLSKDVAGNQRAEDRLRNALGGVSRGSKLASQLLAFGRRQPLEPKVVNIGRFLRGLDDLLRRAIGEEVELETVIGGGLWNTSVDIGQLENAILNLAINARDAMNGHGKLTIEAGNAFIDDEYASRHAEVVPGQYVMVAVTDTGCGIPPDILDNVFEPFFTTKPEGQGTGLGLSMVYGFVKQSGGHAKIYSEVGQGTTVRLYLPRARRPEDVTTVIDTGPIVGGTETILVAEDDEAVRNTVVDLLTELGYKVLKAKDAAAALVIVESGVPIDLLFTDVVMPGPLRSPDLARKARERLPDIAILFTSGYTDNAIVHGGRLDEGTHLLSKPYTREALARKVRHVLANQAQARQHEKRTMPGPDGEIPFSRQRAEGEAASNPAAADASQDLPRDRSGIRRANPSPGQPPAMKKPLRILVVEDEPFIRMATAGMIAELGHEVFEAKNAAEALKSLESEPVDILLTDVSLPGQSGIELAVKTREFLPAIKVILATGYSNVSNAELQERLPGAVVLAKPYEMDLLAQTVAQMS
jgi:PAS domain S-box-containing protein